MQKRARSIERYLLTAIFTACILLAGCATTLNYARTSKTATLKEQHRSEDRGTAGGPRIYRVGRAITGFSKKAGQTYTFDAGLASMRIYYLGYHRGVKGYQQTMVTDMRARLEPGHQYELRGWAEQSASTVSFSLVDLETNATVAEVGNVLLVVGPAPHY